jgi:hypothetical protein
MRADFMVVFSIAVVRIAGLHPAYCTKVASEAAVNDATECTGERMKKPGSSGNSYVRVPATRTKAYSRRLISVLGFLILATLSVTAQIKPNGPIRPDAARKVGAANAIIKKPTVRITLNRNLIITPARPPIPFKAFEMVDPKTNKPIAPTAIISLPNGKKPMAQQYYAEVNTFEKWLTGHGYSLRTTKPNSAVTLHEVKIDRSLMERQIQRAPKPNSLPKQLNLLSTYSNKNLSNPPLLQLASDSTVSGIRKAGGISNDEINRQLAAYRFRAIERNGVILADQRDLAKIDPRILAETSKPKYVGKIDPNRLTLAPLPCKPIQSNRPWNFDQGSADTFYAYVSGALSVTGEACPPPNRQQPGAHQTHVNFSAEAKAGGTVFGIGGDLMRATGNLGGNQGDNTVNAGFGVFVLGDNILSINKTAVGHWGVDDQISKGLDFSTSFPIPIGPFDVEVTIGARGEAGFEYHLSLDPFLVNIGGGPFVHSTIYAQAGLNVVIAEAGVGVSLTLVNWDMTLGGYMGVGWKSDGHMNVVEELYADNTLNMLSGNLYVYLKVFYPCLDPWPDICSDQFQANIFSWPGIQFDSVLFDQKDRIPLDW